MANGLQSKVNIQLGPIEVTWSWFPYLQNFPNGGIFEPWKILVRKEKLFLTGEQPDAVRRDVCDLNFGSTDAKRLETHFDFFLTIFSASFN